MYHAIVKRIARKNFERLNLKDFDALLKAASPIFIIVFTGLTP